MRRILIAVVLACCVPCARADSKNLQVLTGLSDAEIQTEMHLITASLGVNCDFCHVRDEKTGNLDPAKDVKKEKETARDMMQMTMKLNREQFGGRTFISCNTCHRGSTDPVSVVPLPQPVPSHASAERPTRAGLPALEEITKHYTTAIGDASRLTSALVLHGTREGWDGKPLPLELQQADGKMHIAVTMPNGKIEQWSDATGGWSRDTRGLHAFNESQLDTFREMTSAYAPLLPNAIPANARVVGKDKVGDHEVFIVVARLENNARERLYFDTTSGLLVRRVIIKDTPLGPVPQATDFDDYRDVGGTKFPFLVKVSVIDPFLGSTRRYTDVQMGAKIDESTFAPPPGS